METQWQDIRLAPKDGTVVLLTNSAANGSWFGYWVDRYESGYVPDNHWCTLMLNVRYLKTSILIPTHWAPIPKLIDNPACPSHP